MAKTKIAIACQGGGSQTAFTAGVLISFLNHKVDEKNHVVGLSGTSGGAICATLAWHALLMRARGERADTGHALESFWADNATANLLEGVLNDTLIQYVQLLDHGILPEWKTSPYTPLRQAWTAALQLLLPQFYDFRKLLTKHIDLDDLDSLVDPSTSPVLVVGAADVESGEFKKFTSRAHDISIDALLASAAVPSLSKAVQIGGHAYWDGLFSDNPPTDELIDDEIVGADNIPDQLWVIRINPQKCDGIPQTSTAIIDRRNEMIGNASLLQDLQHICRINKWVRRGAFTEAYRKDHNLKTVDVYIIHMSSEFEKRLNYASKLDRDQAFIRSLMAHGEERARQFLENPEAMRYDPGDHD
jgi:NTE family protein